DVRLIAPGGKSGDAQRLFVVVPGDTDDEQRSAANAFVKNEKACVITPSGAAADQWKDATKYDKSEGHKGIRRFAEAKEGKLVLAARYDGVDLPGDACRVLIIDGL